MSLSRSWVTFSLISFPVSISLNNNNFKAEILTSPKRHVKLPFVKFNFRKGGVFMVQVKSVIVPQCAWARLLVVS